MKLTEKYASSTLTQLKFKDVGRKKLVLKDPKRGKFKMMAYSDHDAIIADVKTFIERWTDGKKWRLGSDRLGWMCIGDECHEADLVFWASYLKDLFNCAVSQVHVDQNSCVDDIFRKYPVLLKADWMKLSQFPVSHEQMSFLLEHLTVKNLKLNLTPGEGFKFSKPITIDKLEIDKAYWVTDNNLLQIMTYSEKVDIFEIVISGRDFFKSFINQWLDSDNKKLKRFEIRRFRYPGSSNKSRRAPAEELVFFPILKNTPCFPGSPKRRECSE